MRKLLYNCLIIITICISLFQCKEIEPVEIINHGIVIRDWVAPAGIPRPDFGIEEIYRMYDHEYLRNSYLTYFQNKNGGFYTHYIDFESGNDTSNSFGTAEYPRKTIPFDLPRGSVVELHGSKYDSITDQYIEAPIYGNGTPDQPIFVRGADDDERTEFHCNVVIKGSYIITENLKFTSSVGKGIEIWNPSHHISIRNCEVSNYYGLESCFSLLPKSTSDFENDFNEDIVFYNNYLHNNVDTTNINSYQTGFLIQENSRRVWITDNIIENGSGNGIKVFFNYNNGNHPPTNIYIARNEIKNYVNNNIKIINSKNVVISQNTMSGNNPVYIPTSGVSDSSIVNLSLFGSSIPENIFLIFNEFYNSSIGLNAEYGVYVYGNLFRDIGKAIELKFADQVHISNNTINNIDIGINSVGVANLDLTNNIISNAETAHLHYNSSTPNLLSNLFSNSDGNALIGQLSVINPMTEIIDNFITSDTVYTDINNNDFTLKQGSLPVNNGVVNDISNTFSSIFGININYDFYDNIRPVENFWDIGAFEYIAE